MSGDIQFRFPITNFDGLGDSVCIALRHGPNGQEHCTAQITIGACSSTRHSLRRYQMSHLSILASTLSCVTNKHYPVLLQSPLAPRLSLATPVDPMLRNSDTEPTNGQLRTPQHLLHPPQSTQPLKVQCHKPHGGISRDNPSSPCRAAQKTIQDIPVTNVFLLPTCQRLLPYLRYGRSLCHTRASASSQEVLSQTTFIIHKQMLVSKYCLVSQCCS